MLTAAGQTLPQQYTAGGQANRKSKFINNTFHELRRPHVLIRILQNKPISKDFTSSENQQLPSAGRVNYFPKN